MNFLAQLAATYRRIHNLGSFKHLVDCLLGENRSGLADLFFISRWSRHDKKESVNVVDTINELASRKCFWCNETSDGGQQQTMVGTKFNKQKISCVVVVVEY